MLVFRLSGLGWAFPLARVREIVPMARLCRPPGLPSMLEGFLNLEGSLVPILRLDRLFRIAESEPGLYTPLLILQAPVLPFGLPVDAVEAVATVSADSLRPLREGGSFNDCTEAEVAMNGQILHVLNPDKILLEEEHRRLLEFQEMARQRLQEMEAVP